MLSRDLIGLDVMVYISRKYNSREISAIELSSDCSCKEKSVRSSNMS